MILFYNMLDISAFNAYVIWIHLNPTWNSNKSHRRRLFLKELGFALVQGQLRSRLTTTNISVQLRHMIEDSIVGEEAQDVVAVKGMCKLT